jgi:hypothetical protein
MHFQPRHSCRGFAIAEPPGGIEADRSRQAPDAEGSKQMGQKDHLSPIGHLALGGVRSMVVNCRRRDAGAGAYRGFKEWRSKGHDLPAVRARSFRKNQHRQSIAQALLDLAAGLGNLQTAAAVDEDGAEPGRRAEKRPPPHLRLGHEDEANFRWEVQCPKNCARTKDEYRALSPLL